MNITTNVSSTSGSSAASTTVIKRRAAALEAPKAFTLGGESVQQQEANSPVSAGQVEPVISDSEKQYFETLFPNAADAIRSYSPYQKNGMKQSASLGMLVDVKG